MILVSFGRHFVRGFNGKPPCRQREASAWESRPDLSRKIYFACCRFCYIAAKTAKLDCELTMKTKIDFRWLVKIIIISIVASTVFTLASTEILGRAGYIMSFAVLAVFIFLGIIFDIVGIAVTAAVEAPFHSMAAHKQSGAAESLRLIKNADKVSSFCNDVVGDVTGIVSGATAGLIAARLVEGLTAENVIVPLLISGVVTALSVGGKALGKNSAINNSIAIVLSVGKLINFLRLNPKPKSNSK